MRCIAGMGFSRYGSGYVGVGGQPASVGQQLRSGLVSFWEMNPPAANVPIVSIFRNDTPVQVGSRDAQSAIIPSNASLYPIPILANGITGETIQKITVRLNHFYVETGAGDCPLQILLVSPLGDKTLLLGIPTGTLLFNSSNSYNIVFSDDGATTFPVGVSSVGPGPYQPTQVVSVDLPVPAPATPYGTILASLVGSNPSGTWKIYAYGGFMSWSSSELIITHVPTGAQVWRDSFGTNHMIGVGSPTGTTPGVIPGSSSFAVQLNGTTQRLEVASNATLQTPGIFSVTCAVKLLALPAFDHTGIIIAKGSEWGIYVDAAGLVHAYLATAGVGEPPLVLFPGDLSLPLNTWVYLCLSNAGRLSGYTVSGATLRSIGTENSFSVTPAFIIPDTGKFTVGDNAANTTPCNCLVDEVGLWKRDLSANELNYLAGYNPAVNPVPNIPVTFRRYPWDPGALMLTSNGGEQYIKLASGAKINL